MQLIHFIINIIVKIMNVLLVPNKYNQNKKLFGSGLIFQDRNKYTGMRNANNQKLNYFIKFIHKHHIDILLSNLPKQEKSLCKAFF